MSESKYEKMKYTIYYDNYGEYVCLQSDTNKIVTISKLDMNYKNYEMLGSVNVEGTPKGLCEYHELFKQWIDELKRGVTYMKKNVSINWLKYVNNYTATVNVFNQLSKHITRSHEPINAIESSWMNACNKGGIRMLVEEYKNKIFFGYGYDFTFCHPYALSNKDLLIPTKSGKEQILKELPNHKSIKDFQVGYYRVRILSNDKDFLKVFAFSKEHVYTEKSLFFAMQHKDKFSVKLELIQDNKPNAYLYDNNIIVTGKSIFGDWNRILYKFKKQYPTNPLVKYLGSTLSGALNKEKHIWITPEEEKKVKPEYYDQFEIINEERDEQYNVIKYCVMNLNDRYEHNVRFRPFLLSFIRNKVARICLRDLKSVIRVYEDSIIFDKPVNLTDTKDIQPEKNKLV